jgi:uncharacterized metal-binding protein YceD (DUF177 family)
MKTAAPAFSHPVAVATLHGENHLKFTLDAAIRAALARELGLHAIEGLRTHLHVVQGSNGLVTIEGTLDAEFQAICVVSLEPFPQEIHEAVSLRLAPPDLIARMIKRAEADGVEDFEPPDTIIDGTIDFGQVVTEFLALSLDPYPRKPGAAFSAEAYVEPTPSPFDALRALKPKAGE